MLEYLRSLYGRVGQRYPKLVLLGSLPFAYMTGLLATAGTALYVDMSFGEFARLAVASWVLIWTPDVLVEARVVVRRIEPVTDWLAGARGESGAVPAWHAAAGLPLAVLRHPLPYLLVVPGWRCGGSTRCSSSICRRTRWRSSSWLACRVRGAEPAHRPCAARGCGGLRDRRNGRGPLRRRVERRCRCELGPRWSSGRSEAAAGLTSRSSGTPSTRPRVLSRPRDRPAIPSSSQPRPLRNSTTGAHGGSARWLNSKARAGRPGRTVSPTLCRVPAKRPGEQSCRYLPLASRT